MTILPKIGDVITVKHTTELCEHFGLDYLVKRINENTGYYHSWVFDGCTGLPDALLSLIGWCWQDVSYKCCLPHDLCYFAGLKGSTEERKVVDHQFYNNLLSVGMPKFIAEVFLKAVRFGGVQFLSLNFSWGFGRK